MQHIPTSSQAPSQHNGWDKAALIYEEKRVCQLWPAQEHLLVWLDPKPGEHILDVACGAGLVSLPLAELVSPKGNITGIDISKKKLELAKSRMAKEGFNNVFFKQMDAEAIDFPDNTFEIVVCSLGLMYFTNPGLALREMFRVIKPGGRIGALILENQVFFEPEKGEPLQFALEQIGFKNVASKRFVQILRFKDEEQFCSALFSEIMVSSDHQKLDEKTQREVMNKHLAFIEPFRKNRGYEIPGEFVVAMAEKP